MSSGAGDATIVGGGGGSPALGHGTPAAGGGSAGQKGLRGGVLGIVSSTVIGVASTAPAYSLAVSLGLVVAAVGLQSPAVMLVSFIPMLFIAAAYYYMNRADPDCGTSFTWVSRAMGPWLGWITGWAIIVADILVMASLAEIAAIYTFSLFNIDTAAFGTVAMFGQDVSVGNVAIVALGIVWIIALTAICYIGIEASARTQVVLLSAEILTLALFAGIALVKVYTMSITDSVLPSIDWLNPFAISSPGALVDGVIVALFIYWGWDTAAAVNEETSNARITPGRASIISTLILLGTYVIVSVAAQAYHGAAFLSGLGEEDVLGALARDVMGSPWDKLLIIAVLSSAAASTQTTILPTARTALSMGARGALPSYWARVHSRFQTPTSATVWMGILSIAWYVVMKMISENLFWDAISALGLMIAFYYGLTGYAAAIYYRHELLKSARNLLFMGVAPLAGGLILTWAFAVEVVNLANPENSYSGVAWFGFGPPLVITAVLMALGVILMLMQWLRQPAFFHHGPEVWDGSGAPARPEERPVASGLA
jgi:amino acid transporter